MKICSYLCFRGQGFATGSTIHLVMACPASLGPLQCLRIWHDNSGQGKFGSWYLDRIDIVDLQMGYILPSSHLYETSELEIWFRVPELELKRNYIIF